MKRLSIALFLLASSRVPSQAGGDIEAAMNAELKRAMTQLHQEGYPFPYYTSLTAIDVDSWERRCQIGATTFKAQFSQRLMTPDLRVGDYTLDNHPVSNPSGYQARAVSLGDDEFAMRHALWRMLDGIYKTASADYLRKQALMVSRGKTDYDTDDLTREGPVVRRARRPSSPWNLSSFERLCEEPGRVWRRTPGLLSAETSMRLRREWSRLRDSEGRAVDFGRETAEIEMEAVDLSTDGTKLVATRRFLATTPAALPTPADITAAAQDMSSDLALLKRAGTASPFNGPALLDPSVAAVVVLSMGLRLSGEEQRNPAGAQTFRARIGKPVLPEGFTLIDDPALKTFAGKPLAGHYEFDDQGIAPQRVTLIDKGILKAMLLSRYPILGFSRSNGHGRAFAGYTPEGRPGVLMLGATEVNNERQLLDQLRAECRKRGKAYGIWIRKLRNFVQQQGTGGHTSLRLMGGLVYLVDAETGALTLIRDLDLVGTPLVLINNILAAGADYQASDLSYGVPISVVTPSLLLADAELQRSESRPERGPILPPPRNEEDGSAVPRPVPSGAAPGQSRRTPTIPVLPHVQVKRYIIRDAGQLQPNFISEGVVDSRQHLEGKDAFLDFKIIGETLSRLGGSLRRLDAAIERLAAGRRVEKQVLAPTMTMTSYQAQHGNAWP